MTKIVSVPDQSWSDELTCPRCATVFEADQDDLDYDMWKTSGYWFNQTAVTEPRFTVQCPSCPDTWVRIKDEEIPVLLRDALVQKKREKR